MFQKGVAVRCLWHGVYEPGLDSDPEDSVFDVAKADASHMMQTGYGFRLGRSTDLVPKMTGVPEDFKG